MMTNFKVQKIRSCQQCGDLLALKCSKCIRCPDRTPRIVELYDWPTIIQTGPCGCLLIACQAAGCKNTMWRRTSSKNKAGKNRCLHCFCSKTCSAKTLAAQRTTRVTVPCAYCQKAVVKSSYAAKTFVRAFCNQTCYFLFRQREAHNLSEEACRLKERGRSQARRRAQLEANAAARAAQKAEDNPTQQLVYCAQCRNVTEHRLAWKGFHAGKLTCLTCGAGRDEPSVVKLIGEAVPTKAVGLRQLRSNAYSEVG